MNRKNKRQNKRMLSALKHGSWAGVLPTERADWQQHLVAIRQTLHPETPLEEQLVERIALALWRLRRVVNWEVALINDALERARETAALRVPLPHLLQDASPVRRQAAALSLIRYVLTGVPADDEEGPSGHDNSGLVGADELIAAAEERIEARRDQAAALERALAALNDPASLANLDEDDAAAAGLALVDALSESEKALVAERRGIAPEELAEEVELTTEELVTLVKAVGPERARTVLETARRKAQVDLMVLEQALSVYHQATKERRERAVPDFEELGKLQRYEGHLERMLFRSLHELEALQARRSGTAPPLARLEVYGIDEPPALGE
jgi:SHS2 domain-containing protein